MSSWYCPVCKKAFSSYTYFLKHHSHRSKIQCRLFYDKNPSNDPTGCYDPVEGPSFNPLTANITGNNHPPPAALSSPQQIQQQNDANASRPTSPDAGLFALNDDTNVEDYGPVLGNEDESMEDISLSSGKDSVDSAYDPKATASREPLEQFTRYKHGGDSEYGPLPPELRAAIELMSILDKEGAPISAHEKIMDWHVKNSVCPACNVTTQEKVTDKRLHKRLRERYNMQDLLPYKVRTHLPHAGVYLDVPCHDAGAMIRDLLTDPRISDDDYLFFDKDPTAPPPPDHEWHDLEDINTGMSYRETCW